MNKPWHVLLVEPQQDLPTVWRLHAIGVELFVPVIRHRVPTGRPGKNGAKQTRITARPMFPGYGFIQAIANLDAIRATRGVRNLLRNERNEPATIPAAAIQAIHDRQQLEHAQWLDTHKPPRPSRFRPGDTVRLDPAAGAYAGLVARVDNVDAHGRIQILLGMIRYTLDQHLVAQA